MGKKGFILRDGVWDKILEYVIVFHYRPMDDWMNGLLDGCVSKT
jgi:hypothetical protein